MTGIDLDPQPPEPQSGIEALDFVSANVNQPAVSGAPRGKTTSPPPSVSLVLLDAATQRQDDVRKVGIYFAASVFTDEGSSGGGYALFRRRKGAGAFKQVQQITALAGYGMSRDGSFSDEAPPRDLFDLNSELIVEMSSGPDLVTVTEEELLAGENRANVGGEMIAYQNVELLRVEFDARIYKLTKFLRGIGDTLILAFTNGLRFTPWDAARVVGFDTHSLSDINTEWEYKAVPQGFAESDIVDTFAVTLSGRTIRNKAPADFAAMDEENGDVTFSWHRRTQASFRLIAGIVTPLEESIRAFRLILYDGAGTELRRFEPLETAPAMNPIETVSLVYTDAEQTADSVLSGDVVSLTIAQVSDLVRDGFEATLDWEKP